MRDFIHYDADADERDDAPRSSHPGKQARAKESSTESSSPAADLDTASQAEAHAELLRHPTLAHPASAEPLAELFGHLQQTHGNAYVQRLVADMRGAKHDDQARTETTDADRAAARSASAQPLDAATRAEMEKGFGENFADVRLHTDDAAARASENLGARAFTRGHDIYFAEGEYNPSTSEGKHLLAHELTHVVQQKGSAPSGAQARSVGCTGDSFEREADRAASAILAGERAEVSQRGSAPAYQRQSELRQTEEEIVSETREVQVPSRSVVDVPILSGASYSYKHIETVPDYELLISLRAGTRISVVCDHPCSVHDPQAGSQHRRGQQITPAREVRIHVTGTPGTRPAVRVRLTVGGFASDTRFFLPVRPAAAQQAATPPPARKH